MRKILAFIVALFGLGIGFAWLIFSLEQNKIIALIGFFVIIAVFVPLVEEIDRRAISKYIEERKAQKANIQLLYTADGQVLELYYTLGRRTLDIEAVSPKKKRFGIIIYEDATAEDIIRFSNSLEVDDEKSFEEGIERQIDLFMLTPVELLQIRGKHFVVSQNLYDQLRNAYSYREFFAGNKFTSFEEK